MEYVMLKSYDDKIVRVSIEKKKNMNKLKL